MFCMYLLQHVSSVELAPQSKTQQLSLEVIVLPCLTSLLESVTHGYQTFGKEEKHRLISQS